MTTDNRIPPKGGSGTAPPKGTAVSRGDRVSHTTAVVLLGGDGDDLAPDVAHWTVEQTEAGGDVAEIRIGGTWSSFGVCFVDAAALDRLSTFFAEAAQKLRYCTK